MTDQNLKIKKETKRSSIKEKMKINSGISVYNINAEEEKKVELPKEILAIVLVWFRNPNIVFLLGFLGIFQRPAVF